MSPARPGCRPRRLEAARILLDLPTPPTAVLASNDVSALAVLEVARERNLQVPGDLSVVGFDDIPEAAHVHPPLTTMRQPLEEMGRVAASALLGIMHAPNRVPERLELPTELVIRGSTAARK